MGQSMSIKGVFNKMGTFGRKEVRIVMVGLDAAGKTTILYRLKLGEKISTIPTIGFNVETVEYKNIVFTVWDVGGQDKIRPLWRHYFSGVDGIIFVLDSSDETRMNEARTELLNIMNEESLKNVILLVLANKQDLEGAMTPTEITEKLSLNSLKHNPWYVQTACATTGEGLTDGLDWLASQVGPTTSGPPHPPVA